MFDDDHQEFRNQLNYNEPVMLINQTWTGIKEVSCLNSLNSMFFQLTENICVDIMHDILEGVALLEVK